MTDSRLHQSLLDLGKTGVQGNIKDFVVWLAYLGINADESTVHNALNDLAAGGSFQSSSEFPGEFKFSGKLDLPTKVDYHVSGDLNQSPIQLVRSRLESFLKTFGATEEDIIDLTIGTTEAMENAVKYSDHKRIDISYQIRDGIFEIRIENNVSDVEPEKDIEAGKYSASFTLMRGMMVMVKLFDEEG